MLLVRIETSPRCELRARSVDPWSVGVILQSDAACCGTHHGEPGHMRQGPCRIRLPRDHVRSGCFRGAVGVPSRRCRSRPSVARKAIHSANDCEPLGGVRTLRHPCPAERGQHDAAPQCDRYRFEADGLAAAALLALLSTRGPDSAQADPALGWWAENSKCCYQEAFRNLDRALSDFVKSRRRLSGPARSCSVTP